MNFKMVFRPGWVFLAVFLSGLSLVRANSITNADTGGHLNLTTSWIGGVAPSASSIAVWDAKITAGNPAFATNLLGAAASWGGIQILNPAVPIAINPDGNSLTLGSSGVDMSLATTGLTISCPVVLGSSQSWNVNNGQSLLMAGTVSGSGNLTKLGSGTLTLSAKDSATGMIVVSNGDFILSPSGNFSSSIFIAAGATFDVSENTGFNLGLAQTLSGSGTVAGPLTASFDSGLIPGGTGTAGTLTISGGLIEGEGVTNYFQLSSAGGTNDLIAVTGNIDLGDLNCFQLKKFGGGNIPSGTYPLITYTGTITNGSVSNSVVQATGVVATLTNITTTTPNEIAVIISPLPLPVISAADFSQLASHGSITLSATNGEAEALAVILTSTNVALSVTNWTPVVTNNFDINGNLLNEAIPANPTAPRQFYIIKEY